MHMVRYTVHHERVAENEALIAAIFVELAEVGPPGLRYAAFRLPDGVTFIHLIGHDAGAGPLPGAQLDSLRAFHSGLRDRCVGSPERLEMEVLGEFGA